MKPCLGSILCPIQLPSIIMVEPGDLFSILPTLYVHIDLCTCSLPNPHPPPSSKAFSLRNLVSLISFHYLHFMWSMNCSKIILATSPLPVILSHYIVIQLPRSSHYCKLSYFYICLLSVFSYKYVLWNRKCVFLVLYFASREQPITHPWKVYHAYSLGKGMTEWVVQEILPLWGLHCTTASNQL